ncbi:MAG: hypothetical protein K2Y37_22920 [Pirellulales bacterium]|nr:hypothetical protein [Pirellulales bacterium]
MIHYSCDCCKRELDPEDNVRYVVKMEIAQEVQPLGVDELDDDRDYLDEIQDALERLDEDELIDLGSAGARTMRFDLCADCAKRFLKNPLGRDLAKQLNFSEN